jgi:hypothetical protein
MKSTRSAVLLALLTSIAASANAVPTVLSLTDCDSQGCAGSDVFLSIDQVGVSTYNITLSLDSTGYTRGDQEDGVVQAGFKAFSGSYTVAFGVPAFSDGNWVAPNVSGIDGGGGALCDGSDDANFVCTSGYANIETNKLYTWNFVVDGGTLLNVDSWAIKFQYCDSTDTDCKGKLLSASAQPIPEPSAAVVFAGGLLAAATRLRRRR